MKIKAILENFNEKIKKRTVQCNVSLCAKIYPHSTTCKGCVIENVKTKEDMKNWVTKVITGEIRKVDL